LAIIVVATIIPAPEHRDTVIAAVEAAEAQVHAGEDGCLLYALHEGPDGRLVMIEKYTDKAAFEAHGKGEGLAGLSAALKGKLAAPVDVQVLTPHPAGAADKGTL
jgi:quinol monooxygenase YgiN